MRLLLTGLVLLLIVSTVRAQIEPDRPDDNLLSRPVLQTVVEAQIERDHHALTSALDHDAPNVRARAAFAFASAPDTSAIPQLLSLLSDGVPLVRTDAAFALAQMPDGVPAEELLDVLRFERDPTMQRHLINALGHTGDAASLDALLALRLPDARDKDVALALAHYGRRGHVDSSAADWLVERLTVESASSRRHAAYVLGRIEAYADGRADTIRHALDSYAPNDPAAMHLLRALGRLDDPADTDRFTDWLGAAADWRIRVEAARALAGIDTTQAHTALIQALDDSHPLVARTAAETLAEGNWTADTKAGVGVWMDAHSDRWRIIAPLLNGLARNGASPQVLQTVERWRNARSTVAYAAALPALAVIDRPSANSLLQRAARNDDAQVAAAAVQGLATRWDRLRPTRPSFYFEALSTAVRRGDPALLYHGASALTDSLFVTRGAADTLAATYRTLSLPTDLEGMTSVLEALSDIGDSTARTVLQDALTSSHPVVRQTAATGLSRTTDTSITAAPRPLPDTPSIDWERLQALGPHPHLELHTTRGEVVIELDTEQAPQTVQAICRFAQNGRYDGVPFHRVVPNFVVQGGDFAREDGFGGPGFFLRTEITRIGHTRGSLGMASAGPNTEGSQFFVPHSMQPHLNGDYTSFGHVVEGMSVVDRIRVDDRITEATIRPSDTTDE